MAALEEASANRLEFASGQEPALTLDGREYWQIKELGYGGDGPAVVLEARIAARLPKALMHSPCRVDWQVLGELLPGFVGEVVYVRPRAYHKGSFYTDIIAATGSYHADKTPVGQTLSYTNADPSLVLYEAASTLDYADIDIPETEKPKFTRSGPDALQWTAKVSEVYEAVREETQLELYDTPLGVARADRRRSVNSEGAVAWTFEEGVDIPQGELSVTPTTLGEDGTEEEGRYARVAVYRVNSEGEHIRLAEAEVDNHGEPTRDDAEYLIELTDEETDSAYEAAFREALRLSENTVSVEFPVVYAPFFLHRGDVVVVTEREITLEGVYRRSYRLRLLSVEVDGRPRPAGTCKALGAPFGAEEFTPRATGERRSLVAPAAELIGLDWLGRDFLDTELAGVYAGTDPTTGHEEYELDDAELATAGLSVTETADEIIVEDA